MRAIRIFWLHFKVSALAELQYRVNFFVSLLQVLISIGAGLVVLALVFGQVSALNGWTRPQMLAVLGTYTIISGVVAMVMRPNMNKFMQEAEDGTLDFMFTKPVDAQLIAATRAFGIWQGTDIIVGAVILGIAARQLPSGFTVLGVLGFLLGLALAIVMIYSFLSILCTLTFWFTRVWQTIDMFDGLFQAGRWPVSVYPGWLRVGLSAVVPVGIAVTVPAAAVTSHLSGALLGGAGALAVVLATAARLFWLMGVRRYTGASA
jgi:ABC-2 type transport system permease protein